MFPDHRVDAYERFRADPRVRSRLDGWIPSPAPAHDDDIRVGDLRLCVVRDLDAYRHVMVRAVHARHLEVHLVHPYPELAVHTDRVSHPEGLYPVVVQTGLRGCVWPTQVRRLVRRLPDWADGDAGVEWRGPWDARWEFRSAELRMFQRLTADCTGTLLAELWADE